MKKNSILIQLRNCLPCTQFREEFDVNGFCIRVPEGNTAVSQEKKIVKSEFLGPMGGKAMLLRGLVKFPEAQEEKEGVREDRVDRGLFWEA